MALVFKIGEDYEMPKVPRNFPKCGNYIPNINSTDIDDCDEVGVFGDILKKFLPKVFENYCPSSSSMKMVQLSTLVPLILLLLWA